MIDLDHFKPYNDSFGHLAGDQCLQAVGRALEGALGRAGDLVARYGGEEFVALLPDSDAEAGLAAAHQLRAAVQGLALPHPSSPTAPHVTVSLGVAAMIPTRAEEPGQLIEAADRALYVAKRQGRDRVVLGPGP